MQSCLTEDGAAGHDLRADHEALFMQVAAIGVTVTLLGSTAGVPELWPAEVPQELFLQRAVDLTADVASAAVAIHRLGTTRGTTTKPRKPRAPRDRSLVAR